MVCHLLRATKDAMTTPVRCEYVAFCDHVLLGCSCMILFRMQQRVSAAPGETTGRVERVEVNATHVDQVKSPLKIVDICLEVPNTLRFKAATAFERAFKRPCFNASVQCRTHKRRHHMSHHEHGMRRQLCKHTLVWAIPSCRCSSRKALPRNEQ